MRIKAENLSFSYSPKSKDLKVRALKNINLTIEEGDFFGIVGHTGSGKSTFVQHLNGLIKVQKDSGKITVGEFDLTDKKCDFKALRKKTGMVFQYPEYQLFAETVKDDVAFGLKNFFPELSEEEREEKIKKAIELVGLDYERVKDRSPFEFSGGQKRRIAIAGVLVGEPEILILDEPAAGLDPKGKKDFLNLLKTVHGQFVKTIIIVSHDMNIISEYCNKAAVFSEGEIYKTGMPSEIFSSKEEIEKLGLELPVTAELTFALKEAGADVENDFTVDDFVDKVATALGKNKGGGR